MRLRGCASFWLLLGLLLCQPGWADIYAYTAPDGAITLSNVPTDDRYTVLVAAPQQAVAAVAPVGLAHKPGLSWREKRATTRWSRKSPVPMASKVRCSMP
jgi:hypothetical protein